MLRFNSSKRRPVRNYLSRREEWRLLALFVPLGLVIILMRQLSAPDTAERINQFFADTEAPGQQAAPAAVVIEEVRQQPPSDAANGPAVAARNLGAIDPALLKTVEDNTHFRNAEQDAWFHLFGILHAASASDVAAATSAEVSYVQLVEQPHAYRGRLVKVRGTVRDVSPQKPAKNELGIDSYYRVVLEPADGAKWPIFVYCLNAPTEVPTGGEAPLMEATGFFFKNLSYPHENGLGIAPVILAKGLAPPPTQSTLKAGRTAEQLIADEADSTFQRPPDAPEADVPFQEVLALAGWDAERLAAFQDGKDLSTEERQEALELLWRMRTFDAASLEVWANRGVTLSALAANPADHRGELVELRGRVRRVTPRVPPAGEAERLETPRYYECEIALENDAGAALVLAAQVPKAFDEMATLDEPVSAIGLFLKQVPNGEGASSPVFLARDVAWRPTAVKEPYVSFGESLLGAQGFNVGLLDGVQNHRPILASEREAFFQMLSAVGDFSSAEFADAAQQNLKAFSETWSRDLNAKAPARQALSHEVIRRAEEGAYSVAPLFNDAANQIGQLFVFDGMARRVLRIEVGDRAGDEGPSDVRRRFGIEHYYEIELFTDDSQNRPIVFCVRQLPSGFPTGGDVRVPVRMAGLFFKSWQYHSGRAADDADGGTNLSEMGARTISPLLIGPSPLRLEVERSSGTLAGFIGAAVVAMVAGIWGAVWWWGREDRRFYERHLAADFTLPPAENLDNLSAMDEARGDGNGEKSPSTAETS